MEYDGDLHFWEVWHGDVQGLRYLGYLFVDGIGYGKIQTSLVIHHYPVNSGLREGIACAGSLNYRLVPLHESVTLIEQGIERIDGMLLHLRERSVREAAY